MLQPFHPVLGVELSRVTVFAGPLRFTGNAPQEPDTLTGMFQNTFLNWRLSGQKKPVSYFSISPVAHQMRARLGHLREHLGGRFRVAAEVRTEYHLSRVATSKLQQRLETCLLCC